LAATKSLKATRLITKEAIPKKKTNRDSGFLIGTSEKRSSDLEKGKKKTGRRELILTRQEMGKRASDTAKVDADYQNFS